MVNNKDLIIPLLDFPHDNIFYFVQILQRKKDHVGVRLGGSNNNSRLVKAYYITSVEKLEVYWEEMVKLADVFGARVSINLNPRNFEKAGFQVLQKIADQMMNRNFYNIMNAYKHICGEYHSEIDKRWIIDIDKEDMPRLDEIVQYVENQQSHMKNHEKASRYKILAKLPTRTGMHLITNPFNLSTWEVDVGKIEIHRNNPTNMYLPNFKDHDT